MTPETDSGWSNDQITHHRGRRWTCVRCRCACVCVSTQESLQDLRAPGTTEGSWKPRTGDVWEVWLRSRKDPCLPPSPIAVRWRHASHSLRRGLLFGNTELRRLWTWGSRRRTRTEFPTRAIHPQTASFTGEPELPQRKHLQIRTLGAPDQWCDWSHCTSPTLHSYDSARSTRAPHRTMHHAPQSFQQWSRRGAQVRNLRKPLLVMYFQLTLHRHSSECVCAPLNFVSQPLRLPYPLLVLASSQLCNAQILIMSGQKTICRYLKKAPNI